MEALTNDRSSLFPVVIHIADSFGECVPGRSMYMNYPLPLTIWPSNRLPKSLSPRTRQKAVGQLQTTAPCSLRSMILFARKTTLHFLSLDVLSLISISKFEYVHFLERIGYPEGVSDRWSQFIFLAVEQKSQTASSSTVIIDTSLLFPFERCNSANKPKEVSPGCINSSQSVIKRQQSASERCQTPTMALLTGADVFKRILLDVLSRCGCIDCSQPQLGSAKFQIWSLIAIGKLAHTPVQRV